MPLHLLGKKSWNVYNTDNIEKVKRDEAVAQAKEEAEEQRMQEIDAERRIRILRGEVLEPLPITDSKNEVVEVEAQRQGPTRERKKRKRTGENDTDFEMRIASEQVQASADSQIVLRKPTVEAPLTDRTGHIDLFPQEAKADRKTQDAERELAKKKKEYEDQYTVRFADAAGFKQGLENPWYSRNNTTTTGDLETPGKDVWGNEDPRRKQREAARVVSNDPLAAMRQGASKVRQVERERKAWKAEKEKELLELMRTESEQKRRKRRHNSEDDLESFRLDAPEKRPRHNKDEGRSRSHRRHHKDRSRDHRDTSRDQDRHNRHHRH